ncbi:MAG: hypothetical protein AB7L09_00395 [Nitrospira sp.]
MTDILNTSRYDTDDVMAIVRAFDKSNKTWTNILIRHMMRTREVYVRTARGGEYAPKLARVETKYGSDKLIVCLIHPEKLKSTILDKIALADQTLIDQQVCHDLAQAVTAIADFGSYRLDVTTDLTIRLREVSKDDKSILAVRNLRTKLGKERLKLTAARARLKAVQNELATLESAIPELEVEIRRLDNQLAKREQEMKVKGLSVDG